MRAVVSLALVASVVVGAASPSFATTSMGTIAGRVSVDGRVVNGVELAVIDATSGAVRRARTDDQGQFHLRIAPGRYLLASNSTAGLVVSRGPAVLEVAAGQVVTSHLEMSAVAGAVLQDPPAPAPTAAGTVQHEAVACVLAGQHPMLDATIEPAGAVQRVRLYFKSAQSDFFYTEMLPTGTGFRGFMPRPNMDATPITYYIAATTTDFAEIRTPEIAVVVVEKESDCEDRKMAPVGTPPPGTQFFTAAGAAGSPAGFAAGLAGAVGGGAGISTTALLIGAGIAGVTIAAVILSDDDGASPSPGAPASPSPTPTIVPPPPSPSPSPSAAPPAPPTSPFQ